MNPSAPATFPAYSSPAVAAPAVAPPATKPFQLMMQGTGTKIMHPDEDLSLVYILANLFSYLEKLY